MEISENNDSLKIYKANNLVYYTQKEEIANAATHFVGMLLGLASFGILAYAKSVSSIISCIICCLGLTIPYAVSTIYHGTKNIYRKSVWRKVDHSSVCFIILACGAPLCLNMSIHIFDYIALALSISICFANIIMCVCNFNKLARVALILDFVCAALMIVVFFVNRTSVPKMSKIFYLVASIFCAAGAIFYGRKKIYLHTIFHLLMLVATTLYFVGAIIIILQ